MNCRDVAKEAVCELSAGDIVESVKSGNMTAKEVALVSIRRIEEFENKVRAWAYFDKERFLEQSEGIDKKLSKGIEIGGLAGVPVGVKDIFNTCDMPTAMGSPLWKDFTPRNDARVIFYLREEEAVIAGKTATAELAVHEPGPTRNPHNTDYYPGTSSSGSAAAVSCGMVPVALGTQTAGSIIRPASYCGVYGFKPSFGVIPRTGVLKTNDTLDQIGWFARTVEDIELLFDAIRVEGINYPFVYRFIDSKSKASFTREKWNVAVIRHPKWEYVDDYAEKAFADFVGRLSREKDVNLREEHLPADFSQAHDVHTTIYDKSLSYYFQDEYKKKHFVSKILCGIIERGTAITPAEYEEAMRKQVVLRQKLEEFFKRYDVVVTLSTSGEPPLFSKPFDKPDSCLIWSLCGAPSINIPVFKGPGNLPFGLQIVTRRYDDQLLFNFVKALKGKGFVKGVDPINVV